jgi:hypothetical protein
LITREQPLFQGPGASLLPPRALFALDGAHSALTGLV